MQHMMMVQGLFNSAHNGGDFNIGLDKSQGVYRDYAEKANKTPEFLAGMVVLKRLYGYKLEYFLGSRAA